MSRTAHCKAHENAAFAVSFGSAGILPAPVRVARQALLLCDTKYLTRQDGNSILPLSPVIAGNRRPYAISASFAPSAGRSPGASTLRYKVLDTARRQLYPPPIASHRRQSEALCNQRILRTL